MYDRVNGVNHGKSEIEKRQRFAVSVHESLYKRKTCRVSVERKIDCQKCFSTHREHRVSLEAKSHRTCQHLNEKYRAECHPCDDCQTRMRTNKLRRKHNLKRHLKFHTRLYVKIEGRRRKISYLFICSCLVTMAAIFFQYFLGSDIVASSTRFSNDRPTIIN